MYDRLTGWDFIYKQYFAEIESVLTFLSDEESRETYRLLLTARNAVHEQRNRFYEQAFAIALGAAAPCVGEGQSSSSREKSAPERTDLYHEPPGQGRNASGGEDTGDRSWYYEDYLSQGRIKVHRKDPDEPGRMIYGRTNMYFTDGFFHFSDRDVFLDVGAYDGDTAGEIYKVTGNSFRHIFSVEPDPCNFQKLTENMKPLIREGRLTPFEIALGDRDGKVGFTIRDVESRVDPDGESRIRMCNAGTFINTLALPPTFIKMDIENNDLPTLMSMKEFITQHRPAMALSVYHEMTDLFKIPLTIREMVSGAELFMRHNTNSFSETVLYVVPL